jgi:hypothetical protein
VAPSGAELRSNCERRSLHEKLIRRTEDLLTEKNTIEAGAEVTKFAPEVYIYVSMNRQGMNRLSEYGTVLKDWSLTV